MSLFGPSKDEIKAQVAIEKDVEHLKKDYEKLQTAFTEQKNENIVLKRTNDVLSTELESQKVELKHRDADIKILKQSLDDLTQKREKAREASKAADLKELQTAGEMAELRFEVEKCKSREATLQQKINSLQESLKTLNDNEQQLEAKLTAERKNAKSWKDKHSERQVRITELEKEEQGLRRRLEEEEKRSVDLQKQIIVQKEKQDQHVKEITQLKEKKAELQTEVQHLQQTVRDREQLIEETKRKEGDAENARSQETLLKTNSEERKADKADKEATLKMFSRQSDKALDAVQKGHEESQGTAKQLLEHMMEMQKMTLSSVLNQGRAGSGPSVLEGPGKEKKITDD